MSLNKVLSVVVGLMFSLSIGSVSASETLPVQQLGRVINYGSIVTLGVNPTNNNDGCTRNNGGAQSLVGFDSTDAAGKQFLAMALTVKASSSDVVIATNGCISFAGVTIPKVFRIEYR